MIFETDYKLENFILNTKWEELPEEVKERMRGCFIDLLGALIKSLILWVLQQLWGTHQMPTI